MSKSPIPREFHNHSISTKSDNRISTVSDDPDAIEQTINMFGTMLLTSFEMLSEHNLLGPYPASPIPNIGIVSLLLIEFLKVGASDIQVCWAHEVVRALDKAGIDPPTRKQVRVSQKDIDGMREEYRDKEEDDSFGSGVNVYEHSKKVKYWTPEDDDGVSGRQWARWDWRKEVCLAFPRFLFFFLFSLSLFSLHPVLGLTTNTRTSLD
jgi:hypothetical protein